MRVRSYDIATGALQWECAGLAGNAAQNEAELRGQAHSYLGSAWPGSGTKQCFAGNRLKRYRRRVGISHPTVPIHIY